TMNASFAGLAERVSPAALLGYLNFSDGRPDPKFERAVDEAFAAAAQAGRAEPWVALGRWLDEQAELLSGGGSSAFRDITAARERLRPIPRYIRGVGAASGPYHDVVQRAIRILEQTPDEIKDDAWFELALMDELAFDPRVYDHGHPVNRRPNYLFGEWDPHLI